MLLLLIFQLTAAFSQRSIVVSGQILNSATGEGVPNYRVWMSAPDVDFPFYKAVRTNGDGYFEDTIRISSSIVGGQIFIETSGCNRTLRRATLPFDAQTEHIEQNLDVCPVPPNQCQASYSFRIDGMRVFAQNTSQGANFFTWFYGNGGSGTHDERLGYVYSQPGTYRLILQALNQATGCIDTISHLITVPGTNVNCDPDFTMQATATQPLEAKFWAYLPDTSHIVQYRWFFGEFGNYQISTQKTPTFTFPHPGSHRVCLEVITDYGCMASKCTYVSIGGYGDQGLLKLEGLTMGQNSDSVLVRIYEPKANQRWPLVLETRQQVFNNRFSLGKLLDTAKRYAVFAAPSPAAPWFASRQPIWNGSLYSHHSAGSEPIALQAGATEFVYLSLRPMEDTLDIGPGRISGRLVNGPGQTCALQGNFLYLSNANNQLVRYLVSDEQGNFMFVGLPYGLYRLVADVPGLNMLPITIVLGPGQEVVENIEFQLRVSNIVTSKAAPNLSPMLQVFPNPSGNGILFVQGNSGPAKWEALSIKNALGVVVKTEKSGSGSLSLSGLPEGMYFLEFQMSGKVQVAKVVLRR